MVGAGARRLGQSFALSVFLFRLPIVASAQAPQTAPSDQIPAHRIAEGASEPVNIDGRLSEAFWSLAVPIEGFRQKDPEEGESATERTEVRIAYDADALYIGVMAFDRSPDDVVARVMQRDKIFEVDGFGQNGLEAAGDDAVAILLRGAEPDGL